MTESAARWLTRELLVLVGIYGLLLSAGLYLAGVVLAGFDAIASVVGLRFPELLCSIGGWGFGVFTMAEGVLWVSGWLLGLWAPSDAKSGEGRQGKDAA